MTELSNAVGRELVESISSLVKPESNGETRRGNVTRVDPDGRTWVRIDGNDFDTCCVRSSVACKPGDSVSVSLRNNRATIEGNYTSPATDDSKAEEAIRTGSSAQQTADMAHELATNAIADAQATRDAAERAEADAQKAADAADSAKESAKSAAASAKSAAGSAEKAKVSAKSTEKSALDANWAANGALNSLGTVQDVMGTLEWLNANSIKTPAVPEKTTDTEVNPGHVYYVKEEDGTFSKVDEPTADGLADYYSIKPGTAYFVLDQQTNLYEPVEFPDFADIASYYVVDKQSTMANFVQSHLTLTNGEKGGLYITKQMPYEKGSDGSVTVNELWEVGDEYEFDDGRRPLTEDDADIVGRPKNPQAAGYIKLATTGVEIYDLFGNKVATYGPTTTIGGPGGQTTIESDVLAVGKFHTKMVDGVAQVVFDNVFSAGTGEDGKSFLRFSDGAGNDLFTVDSTGKAHFAKPVPIPSGGTDATNEGDAADNLMVQSIGAGMEIPAGTDFNTLTTPGNYVCGYSSRVSGFANKPAPLTNAFRLTVFKVLGNTEHNANEGHRGQLIMDWTSGREYYRVYNASSGLWGSWRTKRQDTDVIDVPHGGHGGTTVIQARDNLKLNAIRYTTTEYSAGYIKVKVNSKTSWMLAFDVSLYQSYKNYVIRISGYNYSTTGTWYAPAATMVSASENEAVTVYFGHDSANDLWVAFPAGQYTGVEISAVTNGYTNVLSTFALQDLFTISRVTSLSGTTDRTIAVRRPVYRGEALAISEYGTGANTAAGAYKNITGQTKDFDTNNTADTWVPVFASGKVQHREISTWFNSVYWNDFWQALTSVASSGQSVHVVRHCNVVTIRGDNILIATGSDKADMPICNIPAGYRPPCTVDCIANNGKLWLDSNGNLTVAGSNRDGRRVYFNVTYAIA
ncbi:MAG: hypothetical protein DBY20_03895 [Coriobacteriia bacterium]|nr:MAG: hypothetical protein DBY20_03895 [Coriobacteriia bacterium]